MYAIVYGIYEYFVVYKGLMWVVFDEVVNWVIMISGLTIVILASTRMNIESWIVNLLYVFLLEDLAYWACQWAETGAYPFPAVDWFDAFFASFRVLGGIGRPIPFWPHVPIFYLPGYAAILAYYVTSFRSAKAGRVVALVIGPLFIAILAGALVPDAIAAQILLWIPATFIGILAIAISVKRHGTRA